MKPKNNYFSLFSIILLSGLLLLIGSCDTNLDPDPPGTPGNPNNPNPTNIDPDKATAYLVLDSANEITGTPGAASDGQIKMDVEDTIFSMKGYPLGNRIRVLHDSVQDVAGFFIYVEGASYYYDVPEEIVEGQYVAQGGEDTTSVVVLDLDPPADEVEYPFTIEVKIQPHDPSGNPFDEFTRWLTVEDPEDNRSCNSILNKTWEWNFSIRVYNSEILNVWAPGLGARINSTGGGCCTANGGSWTVAELPGCGRDSNNANIKWVEVTPSDYYVRPFEYLEFFDGGSALAQSQEVIKNWDISTTNFCTRKLGYTYKVNENESTMGEHDFTPGASHMNLNFPDWKGGWRPQGGDIVYTCHLLAISYGFEDTITAVYKEWDGTEIAYTEVIWHD